MNCWVSWNTNALTGSSLETFISNNRMNMYVVSVNTNSKLIGPAYFSEQQKVYIKRYYSRILNNRILFIHSLVNVGGNNETFEQNRNGSQDRILRLKTKAGKNL